MASWVFGLNKQQSCFGILKVEWSKKAFKVLCHPNDMIYMISREGEYDMFFSMKSRHRLMKNEMRHYNLNNYIEMFKETYRSVS